jgi:hypothetical protein
MRPLSILFLYNATQTYTNTVWEHLESFRRCSRHRFFFAHADAYTPFRLDLRNFDAVLIHYSVRLPYDQLHEECVAALDAYRGVKVVFQQDEYDITDKIRLWLERLAIDGMFTCVPEAHIPDIYDPARFPNTRFVSNLTGYAPMDGSHFPPPRPLAERRVLIGYRGRPLPYWYGALGQEKTVVAQRMRAECESRGLPVDIEWSEEARIYGGGWYDFLGSCRAVLGTESGCNLFDDDGSVRESVAAALKDDRHLSFEEAERRFFPGRDRPGLMNQVSPRIFEAATLKVALVLFEGEYSGVVQPGRHYIPLKKDFGNVDEVLAQLQDDAYVEAMTQRTLEEVILSGRFGYPQFVDGVDGVIEERVQSKGPAAVPLASPAPGAGGPDPTQITTAPIRARPPTQVQQRAHAAIVALAPLWNRLPLRLRERIKPAASAVARRLIGH